MTALVLTELAGRAATAAAAGVGHLRTALVALASSRGHDPHAVARLCDEATHALVRAIAAAGGLRGAARGRADVEVQS